MNSEQITLRITESTLRRGTWKVWVKTPIGSGFLRQGFAWRTRMGAERAAIAKYPRGNFVS